MEQDESVSIRPCRQVIVSSAILDSNSLRQVWCGQWDSNPQALRHWNLNPARMPIPPCPRG